MKSSPSEIRKILSMLEETPRRLAAWSSSLSEDRLHFSPNKRSWSAAEMLAHLRSCADVWGDTIQAMLEHDNSDLKEILPRDRMKKAGYENLDFSKSLRAFSVQRKYLLLALRGLLTDDWERGATINGRRHTIFTQARRMALHEVEHYEQLKTLLK